MMSVDHVYLTPGPPTTVSDGGCKFFFKNRHMSAIVCGIKVDETGRRTTAIVAFTAAPALDYPANRCQLYVLNLQDRKVRSIDIPDTDLPCPPRRG